MPGLLQRGAQFGHALATACSAFSGAAGSLPVSNAIWSRQREDISFDQLRKFWGELPTQARRELLRIDKQTLCEQARKNLYCSRCHGLLLDCYSQIVMYGKSLHQEFVGECVSQKTTAEVLSDNEFDNLQDPSVHPWGGLATTKDGMLTLIDCFISTNSPDVIYKVFNSARQREHDRELLYPDACGGGGRGWISQGLANYGRVHGTRETCALHTSRLSCDTLLDFWSALGDETRSSLLHMKEDDFIERLMYRFDSKRFCRDCRRNVLREFKELKELKRYRKELRCTSWFCVADTAIQYEVSEDSVVVDWQHSFTDTSTYHHFEWAVGTAEGKNDILDFEDVGMNGKVEVKGLDLSSFSACFITLRAWKLDGRCTELSVKAHALKGRTCVHRRLIVGDGFVTITKGDSIKCFFEHAEEVEEEEDDDSFDKDGIELDGDGSRPQKHAKSPELAREFLLDAATVIFKEQVEKAFREGTARQNSHSLFVALAIKLLEDCVHVACKEIITLEKQIKLLEEEENEKREEEERRERRRNKEREKKLRRKERLKEKDKDREIVFIIEAKPFRTDLPTPANNSLTSINDESLYNLGDSLSDQRDADDIIVQPNSTDTPKLQRDIPCLREEGAQFEQSAVLDQSKSCRRKLLFKRVALPDQAPKWYDKHRFSNVTSIEHESNMKPKASSRCLNVGPRTFRERVGRMDSQSCRSNHHPGEHRPKDWYHISTIRVGRETANSTANLPRQLSHHNRGGYIPDKLVTRQVWEPTDARKKYNRSNLGTAKGEPSADQMDTRKDSNKSDSATSLQEKPLCCNPIMVSSSSDSCSSCPSEGDSSTSCFSSTLNAETSSTSDSEDAAGQQLDVSACNADARPKNRNNSQPIIRSGFPPHQHMLHLPMPTFSSEIMVYENQSTISWSGTPINGLLPFSQHNHHYMFPPTVGYGLQANRSSGFVNLQPPTTNLEQHHSYHAIRTDSKAYPDRPNVIGEKSSESKQHPSTEGTDTKSFSLFHFGGPLVGATAYGVKPEHVGPTPKPQDNISCSMEETKVEEYSLFAVKNSSMFLFSSFTL